MTIPASSFLMNGLTPFEDMALTVVKAQIERGEDPTPNIAFFLISALIRITTPEIVEEPA